MTGLAGYLRRLIGGHDGQGDAPVPDAPFWAVGDIHGRADLLQALEPVMIAQAPGIPAVFLGDYIDRGSDSAEVLHLLSSGSEEGAQPIVCLMGNHEAMCLDFLDDPQQAGPRWLYNGGVQTLERFGMHGLSPGSTGAALDAARDALAEAMGEALIDWLRARPLTWQSGNVIALHAAADPNLAIAAQSRRTLLWGHPEFARTRRRDGLWIVHGHTIVEAPMLAGGRISIDTGAYATGRLTAALITPKGVTFHST